MSRTGGLAAPLFFASLAFAGVGSRFGLVTPWALSAIALLAAGLAGAAQSVATNRIAAVVYGLALLVALNTLLLSPAYTPAGLYHPLLLALAFASFRRFDDLAERRAAIAALAGGGILAVWGMAQIGPLAIARAHALFETPATYAAFMNLLLVPLLALALVRRVGPLLLATGVLLAAAVFASASRGAFLSNAAGLGVALLLAHRAGLLQPRRVLTVCGLIAAGWILVASIRALPVAGAPRESLPSMQAQAASSQSRLELYGVSWRAWQERPFAGTGYLTFRYALERDRRQVPSYGDASETWFAHNDYLQTLQELGPLGLAGLLALALSPALILYRRLPTIPQAQQPVALAAASGLMAMATHALMDFPFYIPACLVLYGALLGTLDRRVGAAGFVRTPPAARTTWGRAIRIGVVAILILQLLRPVLAEASAEWGMHRYAGDHAQSAAFWLETARRLEPADWRYHWYAGQFWDGVASVARSRDAARYASEAFADGVEANSLDVSNLLGLIAVHRRHGSLLPNPADRATRAAWVARAESLAPYNAGVRQERALLEGAQ